MNTFLIDTSTFFYLFVKDRLLNGFFLKKNRNFRYPNKSSGEKINARVPLTGVNIISIT